MSTACPDRLAIPKLATVPKVSIAIICFNFYYYGSVLLPRDLFVSYSQLIFGSSPAKLMLRKFLRRA